MNNDAITRLHVRDSVLAIIITTMLAAVLATAAPNAAYAADSDNGPVGSSEAHATIICQYPAWDGSWVPVWADEDWDGELGDEDVWADDEWDDDDWWSDDDWYDDEGDDSDDEWLADDEWDDDDWWSDDDDWYDEDDEWYEDDDEDWYDDDDEWLDDEDDEWWADEDEDEDWYDDEWSDVAEGELLVGDFGEGWIIDGYYPIYWCALDVAYDAPAQPDATAVSYASDISVPAISQKIAHAYTIPLAERFGGDARWGIPSTWRYSFLQHWLSYFAQCPLLQVLMGR